jgi:hypothetical protein
VYSLNDLPKQLALLCHEQSISFLKSDSMPVKTQSSSMFFFIPFTTASILSNRKTSQGEHTSSIYRQERIELDVRS